MRLLPGVIAISLAIIGGCATTASDKVTCNPADSCQYSKEMPPIPDAYVVKKTGNICTKEKIVAWRSVAEQKDGVKVWLPTKEVATVQCPANLKP